MSGKSTSPLITNLLVLLDLYTEFMNDGGDYFPLPRIQKWFENPRSDWQDSQGDQLHEEKGKIPFTEKKRSAQKLTIKNNNSLDQPQTSLYDRYSWIRLWPCTSVWISARNPEHWAQPLYSKERNPQADREGYEPDLRPDPDTNHNPRTHTNPDPIPTPAPTPTTTPTLALHLINIKRSLTQSNTNSFCCKGRQGQGWPSVPKHNFSRNYSTQPAFLQV